MKCQTQRYLISFSPDLRTDYIITYCYFIEPLTGSTEEQLIQLIYYMLSYSNIVLMLMLSNQVCHA